MKRPNCPKCGGKLKQLKVGSVCRKCYLYWLEPPKVQIDYAPAGSKTLAAMPNEKSWAMWLGGNLSTKLKI